MMRQGVRKRVLGFDPKEIYSRVKVNRFERTNRVSMSEAFPNENGICACGCNQELKGRRRRWASDECMDFAYYVVAIINGNPDVVSTFLRSIFDNWACCHFGIVDSYKEDRNGLSVSTIHKDHIIAVKNGGGGCWIDNYQLLCEDCHKEKTKTDFNEAPV